jgi:hypothetical protein
MKPPALPHLITLQAAAKASGIAVFTLKRLADRGELRLVRPPGVRRLYISASDLASAIETWAQESHR